jgi:lipoprotein-anchoring transpeptidase ErfK/SrfK
VDTIGFSQQERPRRVSKPPGMRGLLAFLVALVALLGVVGPAAASTTVRGDEVWFVRNGKPVRVSRAPRPLPAVVRSLLAGPTRAERSRGLVSAIPARTGLRSLEVRDRIVTVDLGSRFANGVDRTSLRDRVGQIVRTLKAAPGVLGVRIRIEGGVPVGLFPGYDLRRTVVEPVEAPAAEPLSTRDVQQLLVDLGFMASAGRTGAVDTQTSTALLGFQKWVGLPRNGLLTRETVDALARANRPQVARRGDGRRIEVQLDRQVALLILDGRVERVVHVSSGAFGKTPEGTFRVYRKERYSWSVPFKVWLPWASYFTGGVAFHEFGSVPTYAASHGCIRVNHYDAEMLFGFADFDTQVDVFHEARV